MQPFTYLIGWSKHNKWYYGLRYSKRCHPSDLWTVYFTSSDTVHQLRKKIGEPDVIQVRKIFSDKNKAIEWEHKVLRRIKAAQRDDFVNKSNGYNTFFARNQTAESIKKISKSTIGRVPWNKDKKIGPNLKLRLTRKIRNIKKPSTKCFVNGKIYLSIKDASIDTDIPISTIRRYIKSKKRRYLKYDIDCYWV